MSLPARFTMGAHRWRLVEDHEGLLEQVGEAHGYTIPRRQTVMIDATLTGTARAEVLLHELLHAALAGATLDHDDEERMVNAAAGPLLHALRANPRLVAALLA